MLNIKDRVMQLLEYKKIPKEKFFLEIGSVSSNFRGKAAETPLNSTTIVNIMTVIPDLSPEWLLTGKGQMLKDEGLMLKNSDKNLSQNADNRLWALIESQQRQLESQQRTIEALTKKGDGVGAYGHAAHRAVGE